MDLTAVLTLNGIPTVYLCDRKRPVVPADAAEVHRRFWNQGVATVLLLRDPVNVRVFSSMTKPINASTATPNEVDERLVEKINVATLTSWLERLYLRLGTGQYYSGANEAKFDPQQAVDAYLIDNLAAVRDRLTKGSAAVEASVAHAFLGRVLFTCYLCDREIIKLSDYFRNHEWKSLRELLMSQDSGAAHSALYGTLFPALKRDFNGSMFDDDLDREKELIQPTHLEAVRRFLNGDEVRKHQGSLGFWAYDFKFIPVETISAIYEDFLEKEGGPEKRKSGAYHTPRFLAEMTLDLALEGMHPLRGKRFLDPAVGSGIFLVLLFNRLAAEWRAAHRGKTSLDEQAKDLRALLGSLRGVDKNATACRIACFSLYLAFLDQFDPPHLRAYMKATGEKLPSLLQFADTKGPPPDLPVVWKGDFLRLAPGWKGQYDVVVGNPPWAGRGSKQIAHRFMNTAPVVLKDFGRACLLLPSKVFLNRTDAFQSGWLRRVTLDKIVQLADYRFILFEEALCPCNIVRFSNHVPDIGSHEIEYVAPKVSRADLRDGVVPIAPQDRKWVPLRLLLHAAQRNASGAVWKSHLWGTRRDLKFLDFLLSLPRLGDYAGTVKQMLRGEKRWCKGDGFQPLRAKSRTDKPRSLAWPMEDRVVAPSMIEGMFIVPMGLTPQLGSYLKSEGYRLDKMHRTREERIYKPTLVIFNKGFTSAAFFDYSVRYQDALRGIVGENDDADYLLFLTAYLRSPLARYFIFHTAASLAAERDQVHMHEVMRLPFLFPDHADACPNAASLVSSVAAKIRRLAQDVERSATALLARLGKPRLGPLFGDIDEDDPAARSAWFQRQREKASKLQEEMNPLIYRYFGLGEDEITLVEDACTIFDRSATPPSLAAAKDKPTLLQLDADGLEPYAKMLTDTLNSWASGTLRVSASGGVDAEVGLGLVRLDQTRSANTFKTRAVSSELVSALHCFEEASTVRSASLVYLRCPWVFDGTRIYLVKPALKGHWTRTAALNDAADLYAHIAEERKRPK